MGPFLFSIQCSLLKPDLSCPSPDQKPFMAPQCPPSSPHSLPTAFTSHLTSRGSYATPRPALLQPPPPHDAPSLTAPDCPPPLQGQASSGLCLCPWPSLFSPEFLPLPHHPLPGELLLTLQIPAQTPPTPPAVILCTPWKFYQSLYSRHISMCLSSQSCGLCLTFTVPQYLFA